jgi:hypothetical protein
MNLSTNMHLSQYWRTGYFGLPMLFSSRSLSATQHTRQTVFCTNAWHKMVVSIGFSSVAMFALCHFQIKAIKNEIQKIKKTNQ